jgi:hypothetical protein
MWRASGLAGRKTGHLHLVVEVGAIAQAAEQQRRADLACEVDDEIVEGAGLDRYARPLAERRRDRLDQLQPVVDGKHRFLGRVHADRHDEPVAKPERRLQHVNVAVGERVESAGIER